MTTTEHHALTVTTIDTTYSIPSPACFVPPDLCLDVVQDYNSKNEMSNALCGLPPGYEIMANNELAVDDVWGECFINGGPVRLLYWPMSTVGGLCANSTSTIAATPTGNGPNTVTFEGKVFTSPTVYLSFRSLYAMTWNVQFWNSSYTATLGPRFADVIIPEAPGSISTYCGTSTGVAFLGGDFGPNVVSGVVPLD